MKSGGSSAIIRKKEAVCVKKKLLLILPLMMLCLLTGCDYLMSYECYGLPEGAKAYLLVKDDDDRYADNAPAGTELENYIKDGWHCRESIVISDTMRKESIEKNPAIRIAVLDEDGKILKVSPVFELRIKGKCYFWDRFSYNYETNEVTGNHTEYYGDEMEAAFCNWLIAFFDVLCFIINMAAVCRMKENNYKDYYLYLFLNIPNLIIIIMGGLWTFCGYFQAPDKAPNVSSNIKGYLFFFGFVCLVNSLGFIRYRRLKRSAAENEGKG